MVFVSPAARAAETAAWFLRGAGQQLPDHAVIPGLAGRDATGGSPEGMAAGIRALLDRVPDGGRGLAISHTPLVEAAALGLTGVEVAPMGECEGILVTMDDDGVVSVTELRARQARDRSSGQLQQGLEAHGEAGPGGDRSHRQEHAGHERAAVRGVVADREGLPLGAEDDLLMRHEARQADGVDGHAGRRGSPRVSSRPSPRAEMRSAVASAVPLGASTFVGGCISTISASGIRRAASSAKRIMRTAPIAKFGATTTPTASCFPHAGSISNPVVPDHDVHAVRDAPLDVLGRR